MTTLLSSLRNVNKLSGVIKDAGTKAAVRNLEDWADQLTQRLARLAVSSDQVSGAVLSVSGSGYVSASPTTGDVVVSVSGLTPTTRTISTAAPLTGGGALSGDLTLSIAANGIDDTLLRDSAATSVIGRATGTVGDPADIVAMEGGVLRMYLGTLGFGNILQSSVLSLEDDLAARPTGSGSNVNIIAKWGPFLTSLTDSLLTDDGASLNYNGTAFVVSSTGDVGLDGTLSVAGDASVAGTVSLNTGGGSTIIHQALAHNAGNAVFNNTSGTLYAQRDVILNNTAGTTTVNGVATFQSAVAVNGALSAASTLTVTGASTFNGAVQVNADLDAFARIAVQTTNEDSLQVYNQASAATESWSTAFFNPFGTYDTTAGALLNLGLFASATATRSAGANTLTNIGVRGTATGAQVNIGLSGSVAAGGTAYGVEARAIGATATTNYGIYAQAANGTTNWAGYFDGDVNITGSLAAASMTSGGNAVLTTASPVTAHTHVKADVTDFAHTHVKADVTDFAHTHVKADITDFSHTHAQADITNLTTDLAARPTGSGTAGTLAMWTGGSALGDAPVTATADVLATPRELQVQGSAYTTHINYRGSADQDTYLRAGTASGTVRIGDVNAAVVITPDTYVSSFLSVGSYLVTAGAAYIGGDVGISGNELHFRRGSNGDDTGYINYYGYNGGLTQFRSLNICDGKGAIIAGFTGSTKQTALYGDLSVTGTTYVAGLTGTGAASLASLTVTGATTLQGAVTVSGSTVASSSATWTFNKASADPAIYVTQNPTGLANSTAAAQFETLGSYDATATGRTAYGVLATVNVSRSAGANAVEAVGVKGLILGSAQSRVGVWGEAGNTAGGTEAYGVFARAQSGATVNYGIYALAGNGTTNYSGYFGAGLFHVTGAATFTSTLSVEGNVTIGNASGDAHSLTGTLNANGTAGTNGQVLTVVSGVPQWATAAAGGITGSGTLRRFAMFTPSGSAVGDALMSQDSGGTVVQCLAATFEATAANFFGNVYMDLSATVNGTLSATALTAGTTTVNGSLNIVGGPLKAGGTNARVFLGRQIFTASGTYTPTTGTKVVRLRAVGGGGGSGAAGGAASSCAAGGGGASGTYIERWLDPGSNTDITGGTVTIGAGGTGAATIFVSTTAGGDTSVVIQGTTFTAKGGGGANSMSGASSLATCAGGMPQAGSGANAAGTFASVSMDAVGGAGGGFGIRLNGTQCAAGEGGSNPLGQGGAQDVAGSGPGLTGAGYGAGASGAKASLTTARAGANGTAGVVIIEEYA